MNRRGFIKSAARGGLLVPAAYASAQEVFLDWGSAASSFSPTDISGLIGWWKADAGCYVSGTTPAVNNDTITTWADQSGNGNDFTQSTSGKRPTFKTGIVGSLPVVRCGAHAMTSVTNLPASHTIIFVERVTANSGGIRTLGVTNDFNFVLSGSRSDGFSAYANALISGSYTTATAMCVNVLRGQSGSNYAYFTNGTNNTTGSVSTISGLGALTIGFDGRSEYPQCDICEILVYNSSLSDSNRSSVESYLRSSSRWNF